jgi:two-component system phosphate regulon sensor histidine kinase PhoR
VIAVLVLDGVTFRNSFQLEKLREQSVIEATLLLAKEKADRLEKRIIDQDNFIASTIDIENRPNFGTDWLESARVQTPTGRAVFLLDYASPNHEVLAMSSRYPGLEDEHFRAMLHLVFLPEMLKDDSIGDELHHLHRSVDGTNYLLSFWQRESQGRRYWVVVWHDVGAIIRYIFPELYPSADKTSHINVVDDQGRIVYGEVLNSMGPILGRQFGTTLYKWRLNVTMTAASDLAAAVARRHVLEMVMVGLSGLVVIAGSIVILVAAARERKLSNLKSDFVANVSHELKTPLSLVRMFGELLQSGRVDSDEKQRQYLQIIVSESERLAALIENVLDFAKVERGKAAYDFALGNLVDVVARAVEACRIRAERDGVDLEYGFELPTILIEMDERAIEIAVINLVDNAVKYAADGKRVRVQLGIQGSRAEIRVTDWGPGIAPDERRRVFERFVRGRSTHNQRIRGSGIGLALVKHIAEAHGGDAWVEDSAGSGACFIISLRKDGSWRKVLASVGSG